MQDMNATITKEEAEIMFHQPKNNILRITKDSNSKMVLYMIKNHFLHFDRVEIQAVGVAVGMTVNAVKALQDEEFLNIDKFATDLAGEQKFKPVVTIIVDKKKR